MFFEDNICIKFLHKDTEYYMYHSLFDCKWSKTYSKNASLYIEFLENTLWLTLKKDSILYFTLTPEIESEQKGIYIFSESFTLEYFKKLFTDNKDLYITEFLMSKNFFYGMHNILKSEILAYSKISPRRINASIKEDKIEKLYEAIFIISRLLFNASIKLHDYEFLVYNVSGVKKEKFKDNLITYWNHDKQF
jgi:formamidopyrimidine-DNA glycosylase